MDLLEVNGDKLRKLRDNLGWTREFLSEKSEVPVRTIQDIETGAVKSPGIETLKKIVEAMEPFKGSASHRSELILTIVPLLSSLNISQLGIILRRARHFAAVKKVEKKSSAS